MRVARVGLAFLAATAVAVPAAAQQSQSERTSPIIVEGRNSPTVREAVDTVNRVARPVGGQLARFYDPVCPMVSGVGEAFAGQFVDRIEAIARFADARIGEEGCYPNLFVVIVDDGPAFVRELEASQRVNFTGLSKRERAELEKPGAARSWSVTLLRNSDGQAASQPAASLGLGTVKWGYQGSSVQFSSGTKVLRIYDASNVKPQVQQTIASSWVVIETAAAKDLPLMQVADYAAMRGLAMVDPAELDGSEDTILTLFEPGAAEKPESITQFDIAYLTGLYRTPGLRWARSQVRTIARDIAGAYDDEGEP